MKYGGLSGCKYEEEWETPSGVKGLMVHNGDTRGSSNYIYFCHL